MLTFLPEASDHDAKAEPLNTLEERAAMPAAARSDDSSTSDQFSKSVAGPVPSPLLSTR